MKKIIKPLIIFLITGIFKEYKKIESTLALNNKKIITILKN